MTSKFSRFMNIERSRGERPTSEATPGLQAGNRFEEVKGPGASAQAPVAVPEAHLNRFRGEAPLALQEEGPGAEFPRCARCEAENGRFSQHCHLCGADLHTPEQRAYNVKRQQDRQAAEAQHAAEVEAHFRARKQAELERQQDTDRYHQMLKQQLRETSRGADAPLFEGHLSLGMRLLHLIPHNGMRWAVLAACIATPVLLIRYGRGTTESVGWFVGLIVFVLMAPHWFWKRWWGGRW